MLYPKYKSVPTLSGNLAGRRKYRSVENYLIKNASIFQVYRIVFSGGEHNFVVYNN